LRFVKSTRPILGGISVGIKGYHAIATLALAAAAVAEIGNADQGAISQKPDLPAYARQPSAGELAVQADATPVRLPPADLAEQPRFDPELDPVPELTRELASSVMFPESGDAGPRAAAISSLAAPLPPIGAVLRDEAPNLQPGLLQSRDELAGFDAPAAPAQPHLSPTEESELALELSAAQRINVQRRLALAGFDPNGFDGVFGDRTRGAIADFQTAWSFPASGYLDTSVIAELNQRTESAYQALRRQAAAQPAAAPTIAPVESQVATADAAGECARYSDGRIVERQSLACDIAGLSEKFAVSLGRNRLAQEDAALTNAPAPAIAPRSYRGVDR